MKIIRSLLAVVAVTLIAVHASFAIPSTGVPEIDPAMGTGALALLGGAIMVIRGRKKA
jgi:LPXTG-motif cell wall-anchored protein